MDCMASNTRFTSQGCAEGSAEELTSEKEAEITSEKTEQSKASPTERYPIFFEEDHHHAPKKKKKGLFSFTKHEEEREESIEEIFASKKEEPKDAPEAFSEKGETANEPVKADEVFEKLAEEVAEEKKELSDEERRALAMAIFAGESENGKEADSTGLFPGIGKSDKPDLSKIDEVFNHTRGFVSGTTSKEEYDETTALLMEVFGSEKEKKKKQKAESETAKAPAEESASVEETVAEPDEEGRESAEVGANEAEAPSDGDDYVAVHNDSTESTYVAVHDAMTEGTKEYKAFSGSIEDALSAIVPEEEGNFVPELSDEVKVPDTDNPYHDTYDELEEEKDLNRGILPEDYTSPEQYDEFCESLRGRSFRSLCAAIWTFILTLALLYLESASFSAIPHPELLRPNGAFRLVFLLVDLQLVIVSALFILQNLKNGLKSLLRGKPGRDSITLLIIAFTVLHAVSMIFVHAESVMLFGTVAAMSAFLSSLAEFFDVKRIYRSFRICASKKAKLVATKVVGESAELESFREFIPQNPEIFTVEKADFVDHFFKRVSAPARAEKSYGIVLTLSLIFSVLFAGFRFWQSGEVSEMISSFVTMAMMTLPLCGLFSIVVPFSRISVKADKKDCAIVSMDSADTYSGADVVSFTDKEIFPPKNVKVTTIRTYGHTRIDKAILYAAMVFQKLGGPLSVVFKKTISGVYADISEDFDFLEITADGMCAKIEGQDIFIGNKEYMLFYDFGYTKDEQDEEFENKVGRIMYMVIGGELAAKFYIRYSLSPRFEKTIQALYKSGICPAVKTCDPNVDTALLRMLLKEKRITAGVIKTTDAMKDAPLIDRSESGVVCTSTISNMLHTFTLCDSLCHLVKTNAVLKILSLLAGAGIVLFLSLSGNISTVTTLFIMIYQLLWLIPTTVPSLAE